MKAYPSKAMLNRELSWMKYNDRVLKQGGRADLPLFERAKYMGIHSSDLDRFFQTRMGGILERKEAGDPGRDASGLNPKALLKGLYLAVNQTYDNQALIYQKWIKAAKREGLPYLHPADLKGKNQKRLMVYFNRQIAPTLSPMMARGDGSLIADDRLAVLLKMKKKKVGLVFVPRFMDRLIDGEAAIGQKGFFLMEDLIRFAADRLFPNEQIKDTLVFRVTRNKKEDRTKADRLEFLDAIEKEIFRRKPGRIVRVEIDHDRDWAVDFLQDYLGIRKGICLETKAPIDLGFMADWREKRSGSRGFYPAFAPVERAWWKADIFQAIKNRDRIHSVPYEKYGPVENFLESAANDISVVAIWQTLYRPSAASTLVESLCRAARMGKQVTVVMELRARFDECDSIRAAKRLKEAGCQVILGQPGHKVHAKAILIVRREAKGLRTYAHMGTGNYNEDRAQTDTDFGYFTADQAVGRDLVKLFSYLTGAGKPPATEKVAIAPFDLRESLMGQIQFMMSAAKRGEPALIFLKMNHLVDQKMIHALYEASQAGVRVECLVRGICCLRPGIGGISENIQVKSTVGRFLEHQRVFCFMTTDSDRMFLSSGDWMPRNLNRRIELMFPVEDQAARACIQDWLRLSWQDENRTQVMDGKGNYRLLKRGDKALDAQACLAEGK